MPAKKGARAKSSPAIAAREAQLAEEAELLRQETLRVKLRNEECELRQRIEEEEGKLLEANRARERDVRNTLAEAERQAFYAAKERELAVSNAQKVQELQEAQATLALKVQENDLLGKEKTSALRRVALLTNELELAQLRHTEAQQQTAAAHQAHQEAKRAWESQYDTLHQQYQALEMRCAAAELEQAKAVGETAAVVAAAEEAAATKPAGRSVPTGDEESAMLLRVMQGEVERYKATATQLQEEVTRVRKEEEKSNLLVGILNTQLESVREDNKRLHELTQKRQAELEAATQLRREAQENRQTALTEMEQTLSAAAVQQRQLELELDVHRGEAGKLATELADVRKECEGLKAELKVASEHAVHQAQADYSTNAAMQVELANQKKDLELALKAKAVAEDDKFNHKILTRAEIDSLKTRLQRLQETMERKDREAFETIAVLKADVAKQSSATEQLACEHELHRSTLETQLEATEVERESLRDAHEALQVSSKKREQELYEQLMQVTARHTAASEELDRLRTYSAQKEAEYTHNTICLNAERENLKAKVSEMTETAAETERTHSAHVEQLRGDAEHLESRLTQESQTQHAAYRKECERANMAERNVCRLQELIHEMEQTAHMAGLEHDDAVKSLRAESRDLRSELAIAKRTIERLECAIGDQAGYRQLTELNDKLTKELQTYQRNVTTLSDKAIALQVEAETMGGYKVKKAQEEREVMSRRLQQMERRYRLIVPLFAQLRVLAETHLASYLHRELYEALAEYDRQVSLMPPIPAKITPKQPGVPLDGAAAAATSAPAPPAAADEFNTTLPTKMEPRRPNSPSTAQNTFFKGHKVRSSRIVNGTDVDTTASSRLPPITSA